MRMPTLSHPNGWANLLQVTANDTVLYFSYGALVAFQVGPNPVTVCSDWHGRTMTGKHLDYIDGGTPEATARRLASQEFGQAWWEQVESLR